MRWGSVSPLMSLSWRNISSLEIDLSVWWWSKRCFILWERWLDIDRSRVGLRTASEPLSSGKVHRAPSSKVRLFDQATIVLGGEMKIGSGKITKSWFHVRGSWNIPKGAWCVPFPSLNLELSDLCQKRRVDSLPVGELPVSNLLLLCYLCHHPTNVLLSITDLEPYAFLADQAGSLYVASHCFVVYRVPLACKNRVICWLRSRIRLTTGKLEIFRR